MADFNLVSRASGLGDFLDCARRALPKLLPEDEAKSWGLDTRHGHGNVASIMGTALHYYAEGVEGERAQDWLDKAIEKSGGRVEWDKTTGNRFEACRQLREMIQRFEKHYGGAAWRRGATLEKELSSEFEVKYAGASVNISLSGHPDKIDDQGAIHDLKTGRTRKFAHGAQLGAYTRLAEKSGMLGAEGQIKECVIHHVPRSLAFEEFPVLVERYSRDDCVNQARLGLREAVVAFLDYKEGGPERVKANPRSPLCSKNYCMAHGTRWCKMTMEK